jgi:serralysin
MKTIFILLFLSLTTAQASASKIYREHFSGGVYIVDGDEAYESLDKIPKDTAKSTELIINILASGLVDKWSPKEALALTYCVSDSFAGNKSRVIDALDEATHDWMKVANVKYIYMPQHDSKCDQKNKNVMFDVRPIDGQPYLARSFFPDTKRPARNILINSSSFDYDEVALSGFIRHELGHTLGFRHEHISKDSPGLCPEDQSFKPLTAYDPYSVMHYPQCGGKNVITHMILSKLDEEGAEMIYPF